MKHFLILLLALGSLLSAEERTASKSSASLWDKISSIFTANKVVLDTKLVTADKTVSSLYAKPEKAAKQDQISCRWGNDVALTFYVDVDKMLGAKKLEKGKKYRLDSISWYQHPTGKFSGEGRKVIISNGTEAFVTEMPQVEKMKVSIHQDAEKSNFTFTRDNMLAVTILWQNEQAGACSIRCFEPPPAPATIRGTGLNLRPDGTLPDGNGADNRYVKHWRFNSPAVRIRATEVQEIDHKVLALIGIGAIALILLIKLVRNSKKD